MPASGDPVDGGGGPQGDGAPSLQLDGDWLFCDALKQGSSGLSSYLAYGGTRLRLTLQGGTLLAEEVDSMDQPTTDLITGPLDLVTRSWSADLLWGHGGADGGYTDRYAMGVQVTFNPDGTRFDGTGPSAQTGDPGAWFGGRVDGTFTCNAVAGH
jgi:hypothetical protein